MNENIKNIIDCLYRRYNDLDNLCKKLQDDINNDKPFEIEKMDMLALYDLLECFDNYKREDKNNDFEMQIKKEAEKIANNIDFQVLQINITSGTKKDEQIEASILLKDKNSDFECWFDVWEHMEELTGDWNKYIFDLNNSKDLLQKEIQEHLNAFSNAFNVSIEAVENEIEK